MYDVPISKVNIEVNCIYVVHREKSGKNSAEL